MTNLEIISILIHLPRLTVNHQFNPRLVAKKKWKIMKILAFFIFISSLFFVSSGLKIVWTKNIDKKMQPKVLDIVQKAFWKYHDERSIAWYTIGTLDGTFPPKSDQSWKCELYPKTPKGQIITKMTKGFSVINPKTGKVITCLTNK